MKRALIKVTLPVLLAALPAGLWVCAAQADAAHTRKWTRVATRKTPTCTRAGTGIYSCTCGTRKTDTTPALGRDWDSGVTTTSAGFPEAGVKTYTRQRCGAMKTEEVPVQSAMSGHSIMVLLHNGETKDEWPINEEALLRS